MLWNFHFILYVCPIKCQTNSPKRSQQQKINVEISVINWHQRESERGRESENRTKGSNIDAIAENKRHTHIFEIKFATLFDILFLIQFQFIVFRLFQIGFFYRWFCSFLSNDSTQKLDSDSMQIYKHVLMITSRLARFPVCAIICEDNSQRKQT